MDTSQFCKEITTSLQAQNKYLDSKYFYDAKGDALFKKIMNCKEYYLSRCELDILRLQSKNISQQITQSFKKFDIIELGPGDASKSIHLLRALKEAKTDFNYVPIDISQNIITHLEAHIPTAIHGLKIKGLSGEYLEMLQEYSTTSNTPKIILFLGSTIGNLNSNQALSFCKSLHQFLKPNDLLFIGFDLMKDPRTILAAYNDREGITKDFNLNLLKRINNELGGNFDLQSFEHFPTYNPQSGQCKSYLISKTDQTVYIEKSDTTIHFHAHEAIFMETSKKYSIEETEKLAVEAGFSVSNHFFDSKKWFVDSIWKA